MSRNQLNFELLAGMKVVGCGKNDPPEQARPNRTVIVYRAASNNLESYAMDNINQMEKAITGKDQQLLVYIDVRGKTPRVLKITHDTSAEIVSPAVINYANHNSARAAELKQELADIRAAYPAAYYGLIMWSHANSCKPPGPRQVPDPFADD